jgi:hypothetical protein
MRQALLNRRMKYVIVEEERRAYSPLLQRRKGVAYGYITSKNTACSKSRIGLGSSSVELVSYDGTFISPLSAYELSE